MPDSLKPRLWGVAVVIGSLAILLTGGWMSPSSEGHGTHKQIGLPECGWVERFGQPCATCGMTTAVSHAANGSLKSSFVTQPAGMLFAIGTSTAFWFGLYAALSGARLDLLAGRVLTGRSLTVIGGIVLAAWIYKIFTWTG